MEKTIILIERFLKSQEIQNLIKQFESIHDRLVHIYQRGLLVGILDFGEYEKTHQEMQNKLQEIAIYFYSNREYFPTNIEGEILKLLEGGRQEQGIYEQIKNIIEKV